MIDNYSFIPGAVSDVGRGPSALLSPGPVSVLHLLRHLPNNEGIRGQLCCQ
jgi:hypothetical protein